MNIGWAYVKHMNFIIVFLTYVGKINICLEKILNIWQTQNIYWIYIFGNQCWKYVEHIITYVCYKHMIGKYFQIVLFIHTQHICLHKFYIRCNECVYKQILYSTKAMHVIFHKNWFVNKPGYKPESALILLLTNIRYILL